MPNHDASELALGLDDAVHDYTLTLATSADARRELARDLEDLVDRRGRLRTAFRDGSALPPPAARAALRRLAALARSDDGALGEALIGARLHRRVLDRAARAVRDTDPAKGAIQKARRRVDRAKDRLVASALPLAASIARKHARRGVDVGDLVQEGTIGLMRAADKYDPRRGPFAPYAAFWVRQQIRRALVEHARTIRVPLHVVEASARVERQRRRFEREHGRAPDTAELLAATRLTRATLAAAQSIEPEPLRYHAPAAGGPGLTLLDHLRDDGPIPDEELAKTRLREALRRSLGELAPRDREILRLRFGIDEAEHTLQELGDRYGITRERIRRIEARALRALRAAAERGALAQYRAA